MGLLQETYWRISGQLSSASLRRFAAALQDEPSSPDHRSELTDNGQTSQRQMDNGHSDTDSSQEDVAMGTSEDVAVETTTLRRHDSLKAKKRAVLAELAQKRLEASSSAANADRFVV